MRWRGHRATLCGIVLAALGGWAAGQTQEAALRGRVLDEARAAIAGAQVESVSRDGARATAVTGANGEFALRIGPGEYELRVSARGFSEAAQRVRVSAGEAAEAEIVLRIDGYRDAMTVAGSAGYQAVATGSATRTLTPLRDVPQSVTVITEELMRDRQMTSIGEVVQYVPGITAHQGENNRDQLIIRGNNTSADFFVNGVRDDVQYFRDLYNLERVEALKGPNAMIFGRGGGGGVINRVTKEAGFAPLREIALQGGSFGKKRVTADFAEPLGGRMAMRVNGVYESSGSFRDFVGLERIGLAPTATILASPATKVVLGYEFFRDRRTADRGITSFQGLPVDVAPSTYYGNPDDSRVRAGVHLGSALVERQLGAWTLRNRTLVGDYDRFYQNYLPGAVNAAQTTVALSAYNNATHRRNAFNQTDLTRQTATGRVRHTLLLGAEFGRQRTENFRATGYFNNASTSIQVPYAQPTTNAFAVFRQSATDADNRLALNLAGVYAQDQIALSRRVQVVAGLRYDEFDLGYRNNRTAESLRRADHLLSPRLGLIVKPIETLSLYGNYSVSYLPSSGDQFSSLTTVTQQVKPEKFHNYEAGLKWDLTRALALTSAVYRLDRTNTRATDPNDPTRIVQTGSQRTKGFELGLQGDLTRAWRVMGGYAWQDAYVTSATTAARVGARVAQVPRHTLSLWNHYQFLSRWSAGLGVLHRAEMFAAIDNTIRLPGYTRVDAALFFAVTEKLRLQANVENLFDKRYALNADNNTNISPGLPRALRIGMEVRF